MQLRTDARNATVTVKDSGPGIPHTDHSRVFERHFRGQHAVESEKPGAGLGLPIVKSIVEAHAGTVGLKSPPDGGALLRITLPLAAPTERTRTSTTSPLRELRTPPRQARRQ